VSTLLVEGLGLNEMSQTMCLLADGTRDAMQLSVDLGAKGFSIDSKEVRSLLDELAKVGLFSA
jgi:hypothetical protein